MTLIRVAAVTLNQTPLDWVGNHARLSEGASRARAAGASVVLFPEMAINGYGCEDMYYSPAVTERTEKRVLALAAEFPDLVLGLSVPVRFEGELYNCLAVVVGGRVEGIIAKQFLANDGVHYEPRWFRPWPANHRTKVRYAGREIPFGDLVLDVAGVRIGGEICEDAWVSDRPAGRMADRGVDLVLGPSASHFAFGKDRRREQLIVDGSRMAGAAYVFANSLGNESGRMIFDGQRVIAVKGTVVARGDLLRFHQVGVTCATIDLDTVRSGRKPSTPGADKPFVVPVGSWEWPEEVPQGSDGDQYSSWLKGPHRKEEEFCRAVSLGLFDYLRKSHSRGFVVSLSGGADSAACAVLASTAITLARRELGDDQVNHLLGGINLDRETLSGGLLDTVYQASENSGETTRLAARAVAQALGSRHFEWNIQQIVDHCRESVETTLGRPLQWATDDIALQNIQARVRAPGIWMLANIRGALLLATSNRSEAAVGYSTMDGDTAGSISPIAGIDKHYLRQWLAWLASTGPDGIGPILGVAAVCRLEPTAELRPAERHQTDEADLMPYELLDAIEALAIRDRREPVEILEILLPEWGDQLGGREAVAAGIERFFRLWSRNQWKRERYAPSFHLDDRSLDPKSWCRFPILSGGFSEELADLRGESGVMG